MSRGRNTTFAVMSTGLPKAAYDGSRVASRARSASSAGGTRSPRSSQTSAMSTPVPPEWLKSARRSPISPGSAEKSLSASMRPSIEPTRTAPYLVMTAP